MRNYPSKLAGASTACDSTWRGKEIFPGMSGRDSSNLLAFRLIDSLFLSLDRSDLSIGELSCAVSLLWLRVTWWSPSASNFED